jgi:hypothetical protein
MATVIDSLLIELGIDASKFNSEQKKIVADLKKVADEAEKTSKTEVEGNKKAEDSTKKTSVEKKKATDEEKKTHVEKKKAATEDKKIGEESTKRAKQTQYENKKTTESVTKTTDSLVAFGTALVGAAAFTSFISSMTKTNASIGRNSELFGMSSNELASWGGALKAVGGNSSEMESAISSLGSKIADFQLGISSAVAEPLGRLGASDIIYEEASERLFKLADALKRFKETYGEQAAANLASQLGITGNSFMLLIKGGEEVRKLVHESSSLVEVNDKNTKAAEKFQKQLGDLENSFTGIRNSVMDEMYPSLMKLADAMKDVLATGKEWDDELGGLFSKTGALSGGLLALASAMKVLSFIPGPIGAAAKIASTGLAVLGVGTAVVGGGAGIGAELLTQSKGFAAKEKKYALPEGMLDFIWQRESGRGNPKLMNSPKGATGHMGFMPSTATAYGMTKEDTFDLEKSSNATAKMMRDLLDQYNGNIDKALAGYNWGSGKMQEQGFENMPKETREYISAYKSYMENKSQTTYKNKSNTTYSEKAMQFIQGVLPENKSNTTYSEGGLSSLFEQFYNRELTGANSTVPMKNQTSSSNVSTNIDKIIVNAPNADPNGVVDAMNKKANENSLLNLGIKGTR